MARTCTAQREAVQQAGLVVSVFMLLPQVLGIHLDSEDFKADVSDLRFEVVDLVRGIGLW